MRRPCLNSRSYEERSENHYTINDFFRPDVVGTYDMPSLWRCDYIPSALHPYDKRKRLPAGSTLHFFIDDECFESVWLRPRTSLAPIKKAAAAITPDFSLYRDWSLAIQIWQTYRTRWLGAFWAANDVIVIPSVSWSTPASYDFCFDGLPTGGTFAVATMEVSDTIAKELFLQGLEEFIHRCRPTTLLVYGKGFKGAIEARCTDAGCQTQRYLSRIDEVRLRINREQLEELLRC